MDVRVSILTVLKQGPACLDRVCCQELFFVTVTIVAMIPKDLNWTHFALYCRCSIFFRHQSIRTESEERFFFEVKFHIKKEKRCCNTRGQHRQLPQYHKDHGRS
jgi:hypothetical protein